MASATVSFYCIEECGYYQRGNSNPSFGRSVDVFADLYSWLTTPGLTLKESQTFIKANNDESLPIYRYRVGQTQNNELILVMWNEVETAEGKFASIPANATINSGHISTSNIPQNNIPGFPTYFWFLPSSNRFATIQFGNRKKGTPTLQKYLQGFLERFSMWVEYAGTETRSFDAEIVGYKNENVTFQNGEVHPKFKYSLIKKRGEVDYIRANREKITKVIRKDRFENIVENGRNRLLNSFLSRLGLPHQNSIETIDSNFKFEVGMTPSQEDLESIISSWENGENDSWSNVGFKLSGESNPRWLKSAEVKGEFDLDVSWEQEGTVVELESLVSEIKSHREDLLAIIPQGET